MKLSKAVKEQKEAAAKLQKIKTTGNKEDQEKEKTINTTTAAAEGTDEMPQLIPADEAAPTPSQKRLTQLTSKRPRRK